MHVSGAKTHCETGISLSLSAKWIFSHIWVTLVSKCKRWKRSQRSCPTPSFYWGSSRNSGVFFPEPEASVPSISVPVYSRAAFLIPARWLYPLLCLCARLFSLVALMSCIVNPWHLRARPPHGDMFSNKYKHKHMSWFQSWFGLFKPLFHSIKAFQEWALACIHCDDILLEVSDPWPWRGLLWPVFSSLRASAFSFQYSARFL